MSESPIVVDTVNNKTDTNTKVGKEESFFKKHGSILVVIVMVVIVLSVNYCKEGFASPDGVIANKSEKKQVRSDTEVDRTWNLQELERSVNLLNRK